jgi:hypothetical protein
MSIAQQVRYKEETIRAFETSKAIIPQTLRSDTQDRGGQLVFLVAGSGGRSAVTRGANGDIPNSDDSQTQVTLTFAEAHDKQVRTGFDIFRAQGNQLELMRRNNLAVIRRKQDAVCVAALETGTVTLGAVGTMSMTVAQRISTVLRNAHVGEEDNGNLFCLVSIGAWNYMEAITQFSSADFVTFGGQPPVVEGVPNFGRFKHWMGINWGVHTGLTGHGTSSCTCIAYHRDAAGYATSTMGLDAEAGYDSENQRSWTRASIFHAAVKLQNAGIVKFTHDDSGLSA